MRITCPRYCGNVKNAVPLRCDYITSRVQAAPQQFEHARLHSACTVLAPKEGYYIINFKKDKTYDKDCKTADRAHR